MYNSEIDLLDTEELKNAEAETKTPEELLAEYSNLDAKLDVIQMEITEAKNAILTPELRAELEAVDAEFEPKREVVQRKLEELKEMISGAVVAQGKTVIGQFHQAVYVQPSPKWDSKKLEGLALVHPEINRCKTRGKPYIQLRRVGLK